MLCQVVSDVTGVGEFQHGSKVYGMRCLFLQRVAKLLGKCLGTLARRRRKAYQILRTLFGFCGDEAFGSMSGHERLADGTMPPKFFAPNHLSVQRSHTRTMLSRP